MLVVLSVGTKSILRHDSRLGPSFIFHDFNITTTYHHQMMNKTRTEAEILDDLAYIKTWFAWHSAYAHIDGKPIVFVYQDSGCDKIEAFVRAAESNGGWYIVPKVFSDFEDCPVQPVPGSWHQYAPAKPVQKFKGLSYTISPGFWNAKEDQPRLPRLNETTWCNNVQDMVDSGLNLQLITTFNEAGEGKHSFCLSRGRSALFLWIFSQPLPLILRYHHRIICQELA